jgi:cephalosporin hydroxylase
MITIIDEDAAVVVVRSAGQEQRFALASAEGFAAASQAWLRAGWDTKYVYGFSWFGRPIIQLPDDLVRIQEVVYAIKPDVVIETGIAHGGSLIYYASLLKAMGCGRVIGVDVEIRPHNRRAIETHEFAPLITMIEGSSIDPEIVAQVRSHIAPLDKTLVILDSNHTKAHVLDELRHYGPLVSVGSYIVATDGIMEQVVGGPRTKPDWLANNPRQAALEFTSTNPDFIVEEPKWPFNEGVVDRRVTYWPDAFIKRLR